MSSSVSAIRLRARGRATSSWTALVLASLTSSCLTYHERTSAALTAFEHGDFDRAIVEFDNENNTKSTFLSGAEGGMVALTAGNWAAAREHFDKAVAVVQHLEDSPPITPETTAEAAAAILINEGMATYEGEGYERVLVHAALAIAYLAAGDVPGVGVEARRANKLLENEEELYEKKYQAGGLGHFVSALAYELDADYDDAYIDYRRMEEKGVGGELAGRALVRLARRLGYAQELEELEQRYGAAVDIPSDAASIVVIAGIGIGPHKIEKTLTVPLYKGVGQVSVPEFQPRPQAVSAVELHVADASAPLLTSSIEDVTRVATENLEDRIAWLAARSLLRGAIKYELTKELTNQLGNQHGEGGELFGFLIGSLFTIATERADLRSWLTLPDSWQAARMFVAPGRHDVSLVAVGGESQSLGTFELAPGETMFVIARTLDTRLYVHSIGGRFVEAETSPAAPATAEESTPPSPP